MLICLFQNEDDRMLKINELLKMIEAQEKAGGESCTPGTELELGENIVDSYGKVNNSDLVLNGFQILLAKQF